MGNSPRDCGPGGQWLGFIFIWWGIVLMGSCPRTIYYYYYHYPKPVLYPHVATDASRTSLMPFSLEELVHMSLALRNACLGMVELAYPESTPTVTSDYSLAMASIGVRQRVDPKKAEKVMAMWLHVFKVTSHAHICPLYL